VGDLAYAGIAAGADGMIVELKLKDCDEPYCDANQAITIDDFKKVFNKCKKIKKIADKK